MAIVARRGLGRKAATRKDHSRTPADPAIDRIQAPADRRAAQRREPGHPNREGGRGESSRPPAPGGGLGSDGNEARSWQRRYLEAHHVVCKIIGACKSSAALTAAIAISMFSILKAP